MVFITSNILNLRVIICFSPGAPHGSLSGFEESPKASEESNGEKEPLSSPQGSPPAVSFGAVDVPQGSEAVAGGDEAGTSQALEFPLGELTRGALKGSDASSLGGLGGSVKGSSFGGVVGAVKGSSFAVADGVEKGSSFGGVVGALKGSPSLGLVVAEKGSSVGDDSEAVNGSSFVDAGAANGSSLGGVDAGALN